MQTVTAKDCKNILRFPCRNIFKTTNLPANIDSKKGKKHTDALYVQKWLDQNLYQLFPFIEVLKYDRDRFYSVEISEDAEKYLVSVGNNVYRYALYPPSVSYYAGELPFKQFHYNPFYQKSIRYGETWVCDNFYYRLRSTFMLPVIVWNVQSLEPVFVVCPVESNLFNKYAELMVQLYRINPEFYCATMTRKYVQWYPELENEIDNLRGQPDSTRWTTDVVNALKLQSFESIEQNTRLSISKVSLQQLIGPSMTCPLRWSNLLVGYQFEDCLVPSFLLN